MRQSPSQSATLFPVGTKKKGNDKNMWVVTKTKNGIKRWQKVTKVKGKKYDVHDNGGRPFRVFVDKNSVSIYTYKNCDEFEEECIYDKLVKKYKVKKVHIGRSSGNYYTGHQKKDNRHFVGNSILLQLTKDRYVFIGHEIYEFKMSDEVKKYYSMVGNSDVPYPVLVGTKNVYFMLDKKYVSRDEFPKMTSPDWENAYSMFYGFDVPVPLKKYSKKMKSVKTVKKRIY